MTSDSGVAKQYSDYARQIQEALAALQHGPGVAKAKILAR